MGCSSPIAGRVRVARAVVPLVVVADQRQLGRQPLDASQDVVPLRGVLVHERPLFLVEPVWLQEDRVGDADLADVVQQAAPLELLQLGLADAASPAPISTAMLETCSECFLVDGSRASMADASARTVWVNIFRISTTDWYDARVVYSGSANSTADPRPDGRVRQRHQPRKRRQAQEGKPKDRRSLVEHRPRRAPLP